MEGQNNTTPDENGKVENQTQTFILRVWVTGRDGAKIVWRGRIQHIQSGDVQYCQNQETLIAAIEKSLSESQDA